MHVVRVPLTSALETLAAVTEGRWRLNYLVGPDKQSVSTALASLEAGKQVEGWKTFIYPLPRSFFVDAETLPDPRLDRWELQPAPDLQGYLEGAARRFSFSRNRGVIGAEMAEDADGQVRW